MIDWLAHKFGYVRRGDQATSRQDARRKLHARFDAASQTGETRRHWQSADNLAADAAANESVRTTLRNRARYERFNNPYMCGQLRTLANDVVGIGPALQMLSGNEKLDEAVEDRFAEWADAVGLARKLRLMREVRASDGEIFARLVRNWRLRVPVKLDIQLIEADQCGSPGPLSRENLVDGIEIDEVGNPVAYYFLRRHPGDVGAMGSALREYTRVKAEDVIHYYRVDRPHQHHGIPEIVSSLNLHAERRSYRQSVLTAARVAASLGAVLLETEGDADDEPLLPFESVELEHGMMTTTPPGSKPHQMRPEQPATTYRDFTEQLINEQARPLNMPHNVAAADSSKYNYASGRLDHQTYDRSNLIDQDDLASIVLRPIIQNWAIEATGTAGFLPKRAGEFYLPTYADPDWLVPCMWIWGGREHVDPTKGANSTETRLRTLVTNLATECASERRDWRNVIEQAGRERVALAGAGLLAVDPQLAPRIVEVLKNASLLGQDAVIELLSLLGVPRINAKQMADAVSRAQATAAPAAPLASPESGNGNGAPRPAASGHGGRILC